MSVLEDSQSYAGGRFTNLVITAETLGSVEWTDCTFERCSFVGCTFAGCRLINCRFLGCDLSNVRVPDCVFSDVTFERSKVIGVDWTQTRGPQATLLLLSLDFVESVLDYANFFGLPLRGVTIARCHAHAVDFSEADLSDAVCTGTDFQDSIFLHTNLERADFTGAANYAIDPTANSVRGARFSLPEAVALLRPFGVVIDA